MSVSDISGLQYPIGQFQFNPQISAEERHRLIVGYVIFPDMLQTAVDGLTEAQLDTRYRPGGWTVRQVVHHLAESHMNAYVPDFDRKLWHPAWGTVSVDYLVQGCAWHARHHIAHITSLRERMGWVSSTRTEP